VRPLFLSAILVLPACAASETAPMSDTGTDSAQSVSDGLTDTEATDTAIPETTPPDTTMVDAGIDAAMPDTSVADTAKADTSPVDTGAVDMGVDAGLKSTDHVHIYISNTCKVSVSPTSFTVPAGETLKLSYHNHSVDYRADVWMMYGGGYLGLDRGATWNETYAHCFGPSPSVGYADINIEGGPTSGCPGVRLNITCK